MITETKGAVKKIKKQDYRVSITVMAMPQEVVDKIEGMERHDNELGYFNRKRCRRNSIYSR